MQVVISRKHMQHNAHQALDLESLSQAVASGFGVSIKSFTNPKEVESHIATMTRNGFVCHVMQYAESHVPQTSVNTVRAA